MKRFAILIICSFFLSFIYFSDMQIFKKNNTNIIQTVQTKKSTKASSTKSPTKDTAQLLARAINGESRGEPYQGQVAVGAVIMNRTRDSRFPNTIAGVIYQPGAFTAVSDGQINAPINSNSTVYKAAQAAMNGVDPTNGCVFYYNPRTATNKWIWSKQVVKVIGKHKFCK